MTFIVILSPHASLRVNSAKDTGERGITPFPSPRFLQSLHSLSMTFNLHQRFLDRPLFQVLELDAGLGAGQRRHGLRQGELAALDPLLERPGDLDRPRAMVAP